ncbi:MAG: cobalamin biosynthesis protein, partial [Litorivicinaceae bacterium]
MDALVLAIAALILSRLIRPETFEPYRRPVIQALESTTDRLPNSLRLPVMVGGGIVLSAIVAFLPVLGPLVTFAALLLILGYGRVTEDALAILTELRGGSFSQAQLHLSQFSGVDADQLDENGVARVAVETQTRRLFTDVFSPLAWFALGGLPGLVLLWTSRIIAERDGSGETS